MIIEQTKEKLAMLKLRGMLAALQQWQERGDRDLDPVDLVGLLIDAEWTTRENNRIVQRRREAHFAMNATVEAVDYDHPRGLVKAKMRELVACRRVAAHQNVIVTGPTGIGKTWLPCALGEKACRDGYRVLYTRAPRLFGELYQAKADGTYRRMLQRLARLDLLIIDDLGSAPLEARERQDLREVLEDRYSLRSTIITSQFKTKDWHSFIGDDTIADAICDRVVHNAHRMDLDGESMRKKRGMNTED